MADEQKKSVNDGGGGPQKLVCQRLTPPHEFRDEEHLAAKDNDNPQLALYAAIDIVSDPTLGSA